MEETYHQLDGGYPVQISVEDPYHQYDGGYAVLTCHIIKYGEDVQYRTTKSTQG